MSQKSKKIYSYPEYYDVLFGWNRSEEVLFVDKLAQKLGCPGSSFLEVACGTGTVSRQLCFLGWEPVGIDLSEKMVEEMNFQMNKIRKKTWAYLGDMAEFKLPVKIDLAYCALGSLGLLTKDEEYVNHFKCIKEHLNEGGIYLIDVGLQVDMKSSTKPCDLNSLVWAMETESVYVEASDGIVKVEDDAKGLRLSLEWDAVPLEFNLEHLEGLIKESGLKIDSIYPQAGITEEGIPKFDLEVNDLKVGVDRAMFVLR